MAPRRRNPEGAWVLWAIAALLLLDGAHRHRLRRRALRSPHNTHARGPVYSHHGLLASQLVVEVHRHVRAAVEPDAGIGHDPHRSALQELADIAHVAARELL